jgi:hypothetical protein
MIGVVSSRRRKSGEERGRWIRYAPVRRERPPRQVVAIERPEVLNRFAVGLEGELSIDGRSVAELIAESEQRVSGSTSGSHMWLPERLVRPPSRHLLGDPDPAPGSDWNDDWGSAGFDADAVAIGGCGGCGTVGCDPVVVTIEIGDGLIRWRSFGTRAAEVLDLGPFVFSARRYEAALRGVRPR